MPSIGSSRSTSPQHRLDAARAANQLVDRDLVANLVAVLLLDRLGSTPVFRHDLDQALTQARTRSRAPQPLAASCMMRRSTRARCAALQTSVPVSKGVADTQWSNVRAMGIGAAGERKSQTGALPERWWGEASAPPPLRGGGVVWAPATRSRGASVGLSHTSIDDASVA